MALIDCPECNTQVSSEACSCPSCGHPINKKTVKTWSPGIAALLSLIIPGAGQMYKGQIINGLVWLIMVVIAYAIFVIPGVLLHLFCILGAASGGKKG